MKEHLEDHKRWWALIVLCLGVLMMVLDTTIVNVALPSIRADLHFTETSLVWVKCRSARIDGSATFTMVVSSTIINTPRHSTISAHQRLRSSRCSFIRRLPKRPPV